MSILLGLFLKNPLLSGGAVLILVMTIALGVMDVRIEHLKTKVATRDSTIALLNSDISNLRTSIGKQNTAIAKMQDDAKKRQSEATKAIAAARAATDQRQLDVLKIVNIPPSGNECLDADAMLTGYLRNVHK